MDVSHFVMEYRARKDYCRNRKTRTNRAKHIKHMNHPFLHLIYNMCHCPTLFKKKKLLILHQDTHTRTPERVPVLIDGICQIPFTNFLIPKSEYLLNALRVSNLQTTAKPFTWFVMRKCIINTVDTLIDAA